MNTLIRIVAGFLLVAHGLVHLLYLSEDTPEFSIEESWLVPDSVARPVGFALIAATIGAFALVGLAVWGVPGLSGIWPALTIVAAGASLVLMLAYFDWRLLLGVAIDAALIAVAVVRPEWTDTIG